MKASLKFLSIAAIASATLFTSCDKDKDGSTPTGENLTTIMDQTLGAQLNSGKSYYSIDKERSYSQTEAEEAANIPNIDFSYAALGSTAIPTMLSWDERDNNTGLGTAVPPTARKCFFKASSLTSAQFGAIAKDNDANFTGITVSSSSPQRVTVQALKVYEFLTESGVKGLFYVKALTPTTSGNITIDIKTDN